MVKTIDIADLCFTDFDFRISEIFPQNWTNRNEFSLYRHTPRPCSALFFICTDLEATFFSKDGSITAKKGNIVFIPKGICYYVRVTQSTTSKIETYTINFDMYDSTLSPLSITHHIKIVANRQDSLPEVHLKNLSDTFHQAEEKDGALRRNTAKIKGEFFLLLDTIAKAASQTADAYYPVRKGIEAFCEEWNGNDKIEKYAALCGVSVTYFYRCFKKWAGCSPIEYRNSLRLSHAENLLRCTDMQIKDISQTVGFDDPFYFCRIFSSRFGVSPQKYRKRFQNDKN